MGLALAHLRHPGVREQLRDRLGQLRREPPGRIGRPVRTGGDPARPGPGQHAVRGRRGQGLVQRGERPGRGPHTAPHGVERRAHGLPYSPYGGHFARAHDVDGGQPPGLRGQPGREPRRVGDEITHRGLGVEEVQREGLTGEREGHCHSTNATAIP